VSGDASASGDASESGCADLRDGRASASKVAEESEWKVDSDSEG
jgi:hypothetical protein